MKAMKKVFAILLVVAMVMGLSVTAFAEGETAAAKTGSITVKNADSTAEYKAYKIFDVTLADTDAAKAGNEAYAYTIDTDSVWLDTVIGYIGGYTKVGNDWYETSKTTTTNGTTTANEGATPATTFTSSKGLTLTLSADKTKYVVKVNEETFSAADFAEALYAALKGYTVVASDATFDSSETYYTHVGGQYVEQTGLTDFEDGVTYYTKGTALTGVTGTELTNSNGTATASNLALGYYFVTSSVGSLANLTTTEPNVTIYDKNEKPPFDKTVNDTDVEIGQTVTYTITGKVPSTTGYETYTYKVSDTLDTGLTLNHDVKVYIGTVTRNNDGEITSPNETALTTVTASEPNANGVTTYTIGSDENADKVYSKVVDGVTTYYSDETCTTEVKNQNLPFGDSTILYTDNGFVLYFDMTKHQEDVDKTITITYSATVNENAERGKEGNANGAELDYSNDPNDETSTDKEEDKEIVYTVDLVIDKYAGGKTTTNEEGETVPDTSTKLSGAEFVLVKKDAQGNETFYQATYAYTYTTTVEDEEVTVTVYSKNGTDYYTDLACTTKATIPPNTTPTKGDVVDVNWVSSINDATKVTTETDGAAKFEGLEAGLVEDENETGVTYYLRETKAPDGYNQLTKDVEVKIKRTETEGNDGTVTVAITGDKVGVANESGTELPSTGGIGTTIFYVVGSILVIGAAILLITKKRMSGEQ